MAKQFLVVDDHPLVQRAIGETLEELEPGCELRCVGRLSEAMRALRDTGPFDLVLFDLRLPDAAGVEGLTVNGEAASGKSKRFGGAMPAGALLN